MNLSTSGYLPMPRKINETKLWGTKARNYSKLILYDLMLNARYQEGDWMTHLGPIKKGECLVTISELSKHYGIDKKLVRVCLKLLHKSGLIEVQVRGKTNLSRVQVCVSNHLLSLDNSGVFENVGPSLVQVRDKFSTKLGTSCGTSLGQVADPKEIRSNKEEIINKNTTTVVGGSVSSSSEEAKKEDSPARRLWTVYRDAFFEKYKVNHSPPDRTYGDALKSALALNKEADIALAINAFFADDDEFLKTCSHNFKVFLKRIDTYLVRGKALAPKCFNCNGRGWNKISGEHYFCDKCDGHLRLTVKLKDPKELLNV